MSIHEEILKAIREGPQTAKSLALVVYKDDSLYYQTRVMQEVSRMQKVRGLYVEKSETRPQVYLRVEVKRWRAS